jgi:hypothetical protein
MQELSRWCQDCEHSVQPDFDGVASQPAVARNTGDSSPGHTAARHEIASGSGSGSGSLQAACDQGRTHTGRRSRRTQTTASARPSVRSQGLLGCDLTENRKLLSGALCVCVLPGLQVEVQRSSSYSSR